MLYIHELHLRLEALHQSRAVQYETERQLHALAVLLEGSAGDRAALEQYVLDVDAVPEILGRIESLGARFGVVVSTDSLGSRARTGTELFEDLVVTLTLDGTFSNIMTFVSVLETIPFGSEVSALSLRRSGGTWEATLTFIVLHRVSES